uniref:GAG-pre-integrase domain-containing protein n=1 Tax=Amphimedon queenslandica TaxID=400682 RepID=A0A1X7U6J5_AMPQE
MIFKVSKHKTCLMKDVLHVPKLTHTLFSVRVAASKGNSFEFGRGKCWIQNKNENLMGMVYLEKMLFVLNSEPIVQECASIASENKSQKLIELWHKSHGDLGEQQMREIVPNTPKSEGFSFCEPCIQGKQHRKPFQSLKEIRSQGRYKALTVMCVGQCLLKPMPTESLGRKKYFVSFIDDYTRYCSIDLMRNKSIVTDNLKKFEALICNLTGLMVGTLRSDNGGKYSVEASHTFTSLTYRSKLKLNFCRFKTFLSKCVGK